jgi:hypothetical protein
MIRTDPHHQEDLEQLVVPSSYPSNTLLIDYDSRIFNFPSSPQEAQLYTKDTSLDITVLLSLV